MKDKDARFFQNFIVAILFPFLAALSVIKGKVHTFGTGYIAKENEPILFWFFVFLFLIAGLLAVIEVYKEFLNKD